MLWIVTYNVSTYRCHHSPTVKLKLIIDLHNILVNGNITISMQTICTIINKNNY